MQRIKQCKVVLINFKIHSIFGITNLDKISNWEYIKGKSLWVNVTFTEQEQINDSKHLSFSFKTQSLNDLLNFSRNLIDDRNQQIEFNSREQAISILNLKRDAFLR